MSSSPHVKLRNLSGPPDNMSLDMEKSGFIRNDTPADNLNFPSGDFNAAHAGRIDAAPRVEVRELVRLRILIAVRMTADQHLFSLRNPLVAVLFDLMLLVEILDRTGRILEPERVQAPPEVLQGKHRQPPELVIGEIPLMAVNHQYFLTVLPAS